ncbi:hypothetical protein Tco_0236813 [Tanacetum coccineum]
MWSCFRFFQELPSAELFSIYFLTIFGEKGISGALDLHLKVDIRRLDTPYSMDVIRRIELSTRTVKGFKPESLALIGWSCVDTRIQGVGYGIGFLGVRSTYAAKICSVWDSQVVSEPVRNSENGPVSITTDTQGQIKVLPPRTAEEILRPGEKRRKLGPLAYGFSMRSSLLNFNKITDAKGMWHAIQI